MKPFVWPTAGSYIIPCTAYLIRRFAAAAHTNPCAMIGICSAVAHIICAHFRALQCLHCYLQLVVFRGVAWSEKCCLWWNRDRKPSRTISLPHKSSRLLLLRYVESRRMCFDPKWTLIMCILARKKNEGLLTKWCPWRAGESSLAVMFLYFVVILIFELYPVSPVLIVCKQTCIRALTNAQNKLDRPQYYHFHFPRYCFVSVFLLMCVPCKHKIQKSLRQMSSIGCRG